MDADLAKKDEAQPLVSVIMITYNSSKYVSQTLDSIKEQTYKNIELIVADDCSTDDTVSVVEEWVEKNKNRFKAVVVVKAPANTGVAPNCNRGLHKSRGEWVKLIAGDDFLLSKCIAENINYVDKNSEAKVVFSRMNLLINGEISNLSYPLDWQLNFFSADAVEQNRLLALRNHVWMAPAAFMRRMIRNKPVLFDEKYPFCEDYPLWLRLTASSVRLHYFDECTVVYRQENSTTRVSNNWWNVNYYKSIRSFYFSERKKILKDKKLLIKHFAYFILQEILIGIFNNKKSFAAIKFNSIYCRLLKPISP